MTLGTGLFADDDVKKKVEELWALVFRASSRVLQQHLRQGFDGVCKMASPTVEEMVRYLKFFDNVLDVLYQHNEKFGIEYEQVRQILNARAQVANMEALMLAVKASNREDYDAIVQRIDRQAVF